MGEFAEMVISGAMCMHCGVVFDDADAPGFPRACGACMREHAASRRRNAQRPTKPEETPNG